MGAHGSKSHRSPIAGLHHRYHGRANKHRYYSKHDAINDDSFRSAVMTSEPPPNYNHQPHHRRQAPDRPLKSHLPHHPHRPHLGSYTSDDASTSGGGGLISGDPYPGRSLRPILAPQSTQFDGATATLQRTATRTSGTGRYTATLDNRHPSSKQVQFSKINPQNRVTFGSTSAISSTRNSGYPLNDAGAVFTRSKDSHRASQLAINVTHQSEGTSRPMKTQTLERRATLMTSRVPTRTSTMRRTHNDLGDGAMARYRSDTALADNALAMRTLPRVQVDDRFSVDEPDMVPNHYPTIGDAETDSQRPKLRVLRNHAMQQQRHPQQRSNPVGSVTELSDIVAANSADSGVEVKPELFSLINESSPHHLEENVIPIRDHRSLARLREKTIPYTSTKAISSKPVNNSQQEYSPLSTCSQCDCVDCEPPKPPNVRHQPQQQRYNNAPLPSRPPPENRRVKPRPLPPEPQSDDECPYADCSCGCGPSSTVNGSDSDYQHLAVEQRSYQAPAVRRSVVLPNSGVVLPKPALPPRKRSDNPVEEIYTAAYSADSLMRGNKAKSTKTRRAPDPPQRRRPKSMFTISPTSEKENFSTISTAPTAETFLAKEQSGALVIVNRTDLETGITSGKYVQYDVAPALLLEKAGTQQTPQRDQDVTTSATLQSSTLLLTTVEDSPNSATVMVANYDSGVSPGESSASASSPPNVNNSAPSSAGSNQSTPPPPLLPPRQRPSTTGGAVLTTRRISTGAITLKTTPLTEPQMRRRTQSDDIDNNQEPTQSFVLELNQLTSVSPPSEGLIEPPRQESH